MKKIITTAILSLLLANNALAFDVNLRLGARGEEVKKVQKFLGVEQSGYYGQMTKKAVAEFQKSKGLPASGHWLAMTRAEAKKGGATSTATSTPVKVDVVSSSTAKKHEIDWNMKVVELSVNYYSKKVRLLFTPTWRDSGTLSKVSRCEVTVYNQNGEIKTEKYGYENNGYIDITAQAYPEAKEYSKITCVAFDFVEGKYTEYKSEVVEIK